MPQYRIVFRDEEGDHGYIRWGVTPDKAKQFIPLKVVNGDFENLVPRNATFVSIEEMTIETVFQLDDYSYDAVKEFAERSGLKAKKAVGSYCLLVEGKGDWMKDWIEDPWLRNFKILSTTWIS